MSETPAAVEGTPAASAANPGALSDEQLMLQFCKGSAEAFTELFNRYKQPIHGFFRRRLFDPSHAEELSQETWFVVLRARTSYQPRALFRTYLYAIGFKILRAHRRKAAFRATFFGQPKSAPDPARNDATEAALWIRHTVEKLDPTDREILMLREFEQLSYAEIADLLQLALNTVRSRLFRARIALRDLLEPSPAARSTVSKESISQESQRASVNPSAVAGQKGDRA